MCTHDDKDVVNIFLDVSIEVLVQKTICPRSHLSETQNDTLWFGRFCQTAGTIWLKIMGLVNLSLKMRMKRGFSFVKGQGKPKIIFVPFFINI